MKITKVAYHRNGICGEPFYVGIAEEEGRRMLIVRFHDEEDDNVRCAVFDINLLNQDVIEFAVNSWRGDHYSDDMDKAIAEYHRPMSMFEYQSARILCNRSKSKRTEEL